MGDQFNIRGFKFNPTQNINKINKTLENADNHNSEPRSVGPPHLESIRLAVLEMTVGMEFATTQTVPYGATGRRDSCN